METEKKATIGFAEGKATVHATLVVDTDKDARPAAGAELKIFIDVPEFMDEAKKDSATMQMLSKWFDTNKHLLPPVEKEF